MNGLQRVHTQTLSNSMKRSARIGVLSLVLVTLGGAPAYAVDPYGSLHTINATGGTTTTDGLKIDVASGQLQITRAGATQLYGLLPLPDPRYANAMNNYFSVSYTFEGSVYTIDSYEAEVEWVSGSSTVTLSDDGKSGSVVNTLVSATDASKGLSTPIQLEVTFDYTYPEQYVTVSTALTLPAGWTNETRLYWNADATLGGNDDGDQFEGTSTSGQQIRGVTSPDRTSIQAFRQVPGQTLNSWAGYLDCPWGYDNLNKCDPLNEGWLMNNLDAPNAISTATNIDNGYGVSIPAVSTGGIFRASFELIFVDCAPSADPVICISEKVPPTPTDDSEGDSSDSRAEVDEVVALEAPSLASTGTSSLVLLVSSLALFGAGVALAALRRRARN